VRILIVGAGGHAQVVADILLRMGDVDCPMRPVGYVDDDVGLHGKVLLGLPVLGSLKQIEQFEHDVLILAIGDNAIRRALFERLRSRGERFAAGQHPRATVAPGVSIGQGTVICAGAIVNTQSTIGANVILNTGCTVDHHNRIGDHAHIAPGAHLGGGVVVGEGALVGIGANVIPERTIGAWSVVGAGATVIDDVPGRATVVGVPARVVKSRVANSQPRAHLL